MTATIDVYGGVALFATNDNFHPRTLPKSKDLDPKVLRSTDVCLLKCLQKIGASRDRICSALLISNEEYDYIVARL